MIPIEIGKINNIGQEYLKKVRSMMLVNGSPMYDYLIQNLDDIVLCPPEELLKCHKDFHDEFKDDFKDKDGKQSDLYLGFKKYMKGLYEKATKKDSYWLASSIGVNVCPYCNRQYIFTSGDDNEKITRPQFDHFYSKSRYPILSISLYNLVPSCYICNHVKGEKKIDYHPYITGFEDEYKFRINELEHLINGEDLHISFSKSNLNIEKLKLETIYNGHTDYVYEVLYKAFAFSEGYYHALTGMYGKSLGLSSFYINRLIWGNYLNKGEHIKRPLAKLVADILDQLEINYE